MKLVFCLFFSINSIAWIDDEFCKSVLEKIKTNNLDFNYSQQEISFMKFCEKDGYNLLHMWAMYSKSIDWAKFLIYKAHINCNDYRSKRNPLMDAVSCENIDSASILIKINPNLINMSDICGWNSLYCGVMVKNQEIIALLIKNGADLHHKDINNLKALDYCESRKIKKMLKNSMLAKNKF